MKWLSKTWVLDKRLEQDSILIQSDAAFQIRLINDKRWPWIIVAPIMHDVEDIDDCTLGALQGLTAHLHEISKALKKMGVCTSTNVGTLGNVVKQMHWHVVGRNENDPNWPGPVWGFEKAIPYSMDESEKFIAHFKKEFRVSLL